MEQQGGVGKFQIFAVFIIIQAINATGYLIYAMPYFLLYPKFDCFYQDGSPIPEDSNDYENKCIPEYFCEKSNGITFNSDYNDPTTLENWISKYDLVCAGKFVISSFSML